MRLLALDEIANNLEKRSKFWYEDLPQSDITDSCFIILPLYYSECQLTLVWSNWCFLLWRLLVDLSVLLVGKEIHRGKAVICLFKLVLARGAQMDEELLKCAC